MEVTITNNLIEILKDDGTVLVINGANVVDEGGVRWAQYNTAPPTLTSDPFTQPNPTFVDRYKVVLHFNDNRFEEIQLALVTNQPDWTDDLAGAEAAVDDISAALVVAGGGGGGGVSSVGASSPLSSSGGATPTISHQTSGVAAAAYTVNGEALFTVNATGHVTSASNATIASEPAGSNFEIQINDDGDMGASPDLLYDGVLQIGAVSDTGLIQLGGATSSALGTVSSNGTLTLEGQDVSVSSSEVTTVSGGDGVAINGDTIVIDGANVDFVGSNGVSLLTNGIPRLVYDSDGTLLIESSAGSAGQVLTTNGPGVPPEWADVSLEADSVDVTPFFYLTSGSIRAIFRQNGTSDGKPLYEQVGGAGTIVWADPGGGFQWNITPDGGAVIYFSAEDVPDPTQVTAWTIELGGELPLPSLSVLYGPTVQDALEELAVPTQPQYKVWEGYMTQSGTGAPTVVEITNTLGGTPTLSYVTDGTYEAELTGAFPQGVSFYSGPADIGGASMITNAYFVSIVPVGNDNVMRIYSGSVRTGNLIDGILADAYFKITVPM